MSVELKSGYFNAILDESGTPDRTYSAEDLNEYFEGLISKSGVFFDIASRCQVVKGGGLNVIVKEGKGQVNFHWFKITEDTKLELSPADVILSRKDRIIVRCDEESRKCVLMVLEGTPSSTPIAPTLGANEISLATVLIDKNVTIIADQKITDERADTNVCGWITGLIKQVDTSELFNQYQAAQDEFINEKTTEYEEWFGNIQNEVKATSLYREYEAIYKAVANNEKTITIPTSINYVHNGLDILAVHVDGKHLMKDVHYTTNGTTITLVNAISLGTEVIFVNKKSIDGTTAEEVAVQVEAVQEQVNGLTLSSNLNYYATGNNDNIAISNIVKNFLNGTGEYSAVSDTASMYLHVNGKLGIEILIEDQMAFDFHNEISSNRRVFVDFGNATIDLTYIEKASLFAVFGSNNNVTIEKANVVYTDNNTIGTFYGFHGGNVRDCILNITSKRIVYGIWNGGEVSNSKFNIVSEMEGCGVYECERLVFSDIEVNAILYYAVIIENGIVIGNNITGRTSSSSSENWLGNKISY